MLHWRRISDGFRTDATCGSKALIMVSSGPGGLELDGPEPALFTEAETAYNAGDLDRVAEIETGSGSTGWTEAPSK